MLILEYLSWLDWAIFTLVIFFTVAATILGAYARRKKSSSKRSEFIEYWVMGRKLTLPFFVASLVSGWYGGIFGVTQTAFNHGIYNFVSQGLVWYLGYIIFAFFIVQRIDRTQSVTMPGLVANNYGHLSGKVFAVLMIFKILPIAYAIGLGAFISLLFNIDTTTSIIIGTAVVTTYCCFGGLRTLVLRDMVQFISMYIAIISVVVFSYHKFGGLEYLQNNLSEHYFSVSGKHGLSAVFLWLVTALMSTLMSPLFYQRCAAAPCPTTAKNGILISVFFWFICDVCTTLGGMYAKAHMPDYNSVNAYLFYGIEILPTGFRGLLVAGILSIILSTLDAFLFVTSSIFACDLASEKLRQRNSFRVMSLLLCGIVTTLVSVNFHGTIEEAWLYFDVYFGAPLIIPIVALYLLPTHLLIKDKQCGVVIFLTMLTIFITNSVLQIKLSYAFHVSIAVSTVIFAAFVFNNAIVRSRGAIVQQVNDTQMSKFLLEILSEEIPALMQGDAARSLLNVFCAKIEGHFPDIKLAGKTFYTPRRIGFFVDNIPGTISETVQSIRGPRVSAPDQAIACFLKKHNLSARDDLEIHGDFYFFNRKYGASDIVSLLAQLITHTINEFVWPKSMRWADHQMRWIRPIHSILCLLDDTIVPIKFGHITSNNKTAGHRFMAPATITINHVDQYERALKQACVEIWPSVRKNQITNFLHENANSLGIKLIDDDKLLEEVSGLIESPYPTLGSISTHFLDLPREVLITTLRHNQRYFMFEKSDGCIAPFFGIVANILTAQKNADVAASNQRVLHARLCDAAFFFENDKKITLESRIQALKSLSFHHKVGISIYDKVQSTKRLSCEIAAQLQTDQHKVMRAVDLMKSDLVTDMVKEFPELQGVMGYYYALNDSEDKEVADAIKNQYKPKGPKDSVPTNLISVSVALAEKLDTLNQMFAHNIKPTGSKDPFALRRAAIGIMTLQKTNNIKLDLTALNVRKDVIDFIHDKARNRTSTT